MNNLGYEMWVKTRDEYGTHECYFDHVDTPEEAETIYRNVRSDWGIIGYSLERITIEQRMAAAGAL